MLGAGQPDELDPCCVRCVCRNASSRCRACSNRELTCPESCWFLEADELLSAFATMTKISTMTNTTKPPMAVHGRPSGDDRPTDWGQRAAHG